MIELDAAFEAAARNHGGGRNQQFVLFARRQMHGELFVMR
jgi:hypothetical protein